MQSTTCEYAPHRHKALTEPDATLTEVTESRVV